MQQGASHNPPTNIFILVSICCRNAPDLNRCRSWWGARGRTFLAYRCPKSDLPRMKARTQRSTPYLDTRNNDE